MFAKAVVDFDEIEPCAYSGSELFGGQQAEGKWRWKALTTASMIAASSYQN